MCLGFTEHRPHSLEARPPKKSSGKAPRCLRGMRLVTPDNGAVTLAVMGNDLMREQPLKSVVEPLHEPESYGPHRAARERPSNAGGYGARRRRAGRCAKALDPHSRRDANLGVPSAPGRGFTSFPHDRAAPPRQPQGGDTMALLQSLIPPLPPAVPLSCSPHPNHFVSGSRRTDLGSRLCFSLFSDRSAMARGLEPSSPIRIRCSRQPFRHRLCCEVPRPFWSRAATTEMGFGL